MAWKTRTTTSMKQVSKAEDILHDCFVLMSSAMRGGLEVV
jgi:hypothetical protein